MSIQVKIEKIVGNTPIKIEGSFTSNQLPLLKMILDQLVSLAREMEVIKRKRWNRYLRKTLNYEWNLQKVVDEAMHNFSLMVEKQ